MPTKLSQSAVTKAVNRIASDLLDLQLPYHGILAGSMGIAIFFDTLYKVTKEIKFRRKCLEICNHVIADFQNNPGMSHTVGNGYTGIALAFNHLIKRKTLKISPNPFFSNLEKDIYQSALIDLTNGNYDYLHGGSGAAVYALSRIPNTKARRFLCQYVDLIDRHKVIDNHGYKWKDLMRLEVDPPNAIKFNLGLAHGIPSILNVLTSIHAAGIKVRKCEDLIENGITFLLHCNHEYKKTHRSKYPSIIWDSTALEGSSRLAWCYGDLGVAFTLLHAGTQLQKIDWLDAGFDLALASSSRRDLRIDKLDDAQFCHGTSGVAYMFLKFFQLTGHSRFYETYKHWLAETLTMSHGRGIGGYQSFKAETALSAPEWVDDPGLLEGTTGIGLVLLSYSGVQSNWDDALLLGT